MAYYRTKLTVTLLSRDPITPEDIIEGKLLFREPLGTHNVIAYGRRNVVTDEISPEETIRLLRTTDSGLGCFSELAVYPPRLFAVRFVDVDEPETRTEPSASFEAGLECAEAWCNECALGYDPGAGVYVGAVVNNKDCPDSMSRPDQCLVFEDLPSDAVIGFRVVDSSVSVDPFSAWVVPTPLALPEEAEHG
jgi:hypothetical protein